MDVNEHQILKLIQQGESLTLEFKSDLKCLPDRELVAAVVALANTEGGNLLLGVEDDGTVTGLHRIMNIRTPLAFACILRAHHTYPPVSMPMP
jgi:predicted HTH transcriptional regulator